MKYVMTQAVCPEGMEKWRSALRMIRIPHIILTKCRMRMH